MFSDFLRTIFLTTLRLRILTHQHRTEWLEPMSGVISLYYDNFVITLKCHRHFWLQNLLTTTSPITTLSDKFASLPPFTYNHWTKFKHYHQLVPIMDRLQNILWKEPEHIWVNEGWNKQRIGMNGGKCTVKYFFFILTFCFSTPTWTEISFLFLNEKK